jgi:hypothetical protein
MITDEEFELWGLQTTHRFQPLPALERAPAPVVDREDAPATRPRVLVPARSAPIAIPLQQREFNPTWEAQLRHAQRTAVFVGDDTIVEDNLRLAAEYVANMRREYGRRADEIIHGIRLDEREGSTQRKRKKCA